MKQNKLGSEWKEEGNKYFKDNNYIKSIECYTKAIVNIIKIYI